MSMYGHKIRMIRVARGFSQEDVAKRLGIAQNTYSRIETNLQKENEEQLQKSLSYLGSPLKISKARSRS